MLKSCINKLKKAAEDTFPTASKHWALLNMHDSFAPPQKQAISQLNYLIMSRCDFLSEINPVFFYTTDDGVHWTKKTADAILLNWLSQLNL